MNLFLSPNQPLKGLSQWEGRAYLVYREMNFSHICHENDLDAPCVITRVKKKVLFRLLSVSDGDGT
uniref:Uncharacterized protein n=2 Tax=Picea TaxID=3328 RepID=A0A124GPB4_PICGL|nr:hypothetical protein ABT39_MTgene1301 [Picea glauca]QHR91617.1 hypothetical protein Q903MT_gene5652 [Picea sitchensis]